MILNQVKAKVDAKLQVCFLDDSGNLDISNNLIQVLNNASNKNTNNSNSMGIIGEPREL